MMDGSNEYMPVKSGSKVSIFKRLRKGLFVRKNITRVALALSVGATVYWGAVASDLYVSEADVLIQHTTLGAAASVDLGSLLSGSGGATNRPDQMLLRSYLLSSDMMRKADAKLHLRAHYSDHARDPVSRMSSAATQEEFYRYYLSRVSVEFDDYAGVLVISAQAFDPKTARAITATLLEEGEKYMNELGHNLAQSQVNFLDAEVAAMGQRFLKARAALLAFQSKKGLVSPQNTAENDVANINKLRATKVELQTRRNAMLAYLTPQAPGVVDIDVQLEAIERQLAAEQSGLTGAGGNALNRTVEEYQRLEMTATLAQDVYKAALTALEKGRVEVTRTLKKISVVQTPTLPEQAVRPRRFYNILTFILVTMLAAGILNLLAAIIRDHKD